MAEDITKKYKIIYADPAWSYQDKSCNGNALDHYKTMSVKDICNLDVGGVSDNDCVLFLWATYPLLPEALEVMKAWGFKYKSIGFQWIKKNKVSDSYFFGLGRWTRGNTECCLIGVKGKPKRINNSVSQLIIERIQQHSKKPDIVRDKIVELMGDLPRVELFARIKVDGWDSWGNEIESDIKL